LLGYATGNGNYKVQDVTSRRVFVSRDVIFEEGHPHRTSPNVGETIHLFDTLDALDDNETTGDHSAGNHSPSTGGTSSDVNHPALLPAAQLPLPTPVPLEPRRSSRVPQPSSAILESRDYQQQETTSRSEGLDWATERSRPNASLADTFDRLTFELDDYIACLTETKASHHIPHSYRHAIATDPDRWMIPMQIEIDTLAKKHTWDLVKAPEGANIMDSMWVYDINREYHGL